MPDLPARLQQSDVAESTEVDVVPSRGCVSVMATRGAVVTIQRQAAWTPPHDMMPRLLKESPARCLVQVTAALARDLVVPWTSPR